MNRINIIKNLAVALVVGLSFTACDKVKEVDPIGDRGQTIVKIVDGGNIDANFVTAGPIPGNRKDSLSLGSGLVANAIDFVNKPTTLPAAVRIRRDVANNADLNKTMTVTVKDDTAAVTRHNAMTGSNLIKLPPSFYTVISPSPKVGGQGGTYNIVFQPGEFAKEIRIVIPNATLLDPSSSYALAFTITAADAGGVVSYAHTYLVRIGAKNNYDGIYELTFSNYHPSLNPGYAGDVTEVHMVTTGANSVKLYWPLAGTFATPSLFNGGFSYFGAQEPEYTVDPTTFKVTVQNSFSGATTFYTMNPGFNSYYDPASKTMFAKFGYSYVNGTFASGVSREWTQAFRYIGPR